MAKAEERLAHKQLAASESQVVLRGRDQCDAFRVLHFVTDRPIEVTVQWGSDIGQSDAAVISVARAESVCVYAAWWTIEVTNLDAVNAAKVRVGVVDQHRVCEPYYETRHPSAHPAAASHNVPAWAREVRLDTDDQALMAAIIQLKDSAGTVRAGLTQSRLPAWIPLGSAATVEVTSQAAYRLVWRLDLL